MVCEGERTEDLPVPVAPYVKGREYVYGKTRITLYIKKQGKIMKTAVYPGSFDPITNGHLDVIIRAANVFDKLVVAVLNNANKRPIFTVEERVEFIRESVPKMPSCEIIVTSFDGLLADFAQETGATTVVKGLRAMSDFEYEFQQALAIENESQAGYGFFNDK